MKCQEVCMCDQVVNSFSRFDTNYTSCISEYVFRHDSSAETKLFQCLQNVVRERGESKNKNQNKQGGAPEKIQIVSGKCSKSTSNCYKNWIPPPGGVFAIVDCFGLFCYML